MAARGPARALTGQWLGRRPLTVLSPESRHGERADRYETQVDWETDARAAATAILFWIHRDLRTLPGMTTNVEFGLDVSTSRAVLGCLTDCPHPETAATACRCAPPSPTRWPRRSPWSPPGTTR
ncbi:nucleoside 2-deoxyribosyltransferase domain-containing protein [Streptomyces nojiriensis]|uniref:nucleoside 2-deoxyribosyltransferase domain-containing protein n=1 Tax=Streptomyces nojiriensis TaxID=66374 RepID=UPI0036601FC5